MTWEQFAHLYPEFVQWIVQKFGPLPEGPIDADDFNRYAEEFQKERTS